jgi:hypothetical protein
MSAGLAAQRDPSWLFESLGGDAGGRGAARVNVPDTLVFRLCVPRTRDHRARGPAACGCLA